MFSSNYKLYAKVAFLLLGVSSVAWNANSASAITGTEVIDNTQFVIDAGTLGTNAASGDSTINTTANPNGFDNQFGAAPNTFLLLGATNPNGIIGSSPASGVVNGTFSSFEISSSNINDGLLNFAFDWSFQGTNDALDSFFVGIAPEGTGTDNVTNFITFETSYGFDSFNDNIDISGLVPGNYDLIVSLTEASGPGNSAAGFDNFAITEVPSAAVPFEFSPTLGLLLVGGLFGGSSYLKRKKAAKINI